MCSNQFRLLLCIKNLCELVCKPLAQILETNLLLLEGFLCLCSLQESEDSVSNRDTGHGGHPVPEGGALFHHVGTMATLRVGSPMWPRPCCEDHHLGGLSPGPAPDSRVSGLATLRPKLDGTWREGARATLLLSASAACFWSPQT